MVTKSTPFTPLSSVGKVLSQLVHCVLELTVYSGSSSSDTCWLASSVSFV